MQHTLFIYTQVRCLRIDQILKDVSIYECEKSRYHKNISGC